MGTQGGRNTAGPAGVVRQLFRRRMGGGEGKGRVSCGAGACQRTWRAPSCRPRRTGAVRRRREGGRVRGTALGAAPASRMHGLHVHSPASCMLAREHGNKAVRGGGSLAAAGEREGPWGRAEVTGGMCAVELARLLCAWRAGEAGLGRTCHLAVERDREALAPQTAALYLQASLAVPPAAPAAQQPAAPHLRSAGQQQQPAAAMQTMRAFKATTAAPSRCGRRGQQAGPLHVAAGGVVPAPPRLHSALRSLTNAMAGAAGSPCPASSGRSP